MCCFWRFSFPLCSGRIASSCPPSALRPCLARSLSIGSWNGAVTRVRRRPPSTILSIRQRHQETSTWPSGNRRRLFSGDDVPCICQSPYVVFLFHGVQSATSQRLDCLNVEAIPPTPSLYIPPWRRVVALACITTQLRFDASVRDYDNCPQCRHAC